MGTGAMETLKAIKAAMMSSITVRVAMAIKRRMITAKAVTTDVGTPKELVRSIWISRISYVIPLCVFSTLQFRRMDS